MKKLNRNQILKKGSKLSSNKLNDNPKIQRLIKETKEKQENVLKLKEVDREHLELVVQL